MKALQKHFLEKRDYVVGRLREMGFHIKTVPDSTFYLWLDLEGLPEASKIPAVFILTDQLHKSRRIRMRT